MANGFCDELVFRDFPVVRFCLCFFRIGGKEVGKDCKDRERKGRLILGITTNLHGSKHSPPDQSRRVKKNKSNLEDTESKPSRQIEKHETRLPVVALPPHILAGLLSNPASTSKTLQTNPRTSGDPKRHPPLHVRSASNPTTIHPPQLLHFPHHGPETRMDGHPPRQRRCFGKAHGC